MLANWSLDEAARAVVHLTPFEAIVSGRGRHVRCSAPPPAQERVEVTGPAWSGSSRVSRKVSKLRVSIVVMQGGDFIDLMYLSARFMWGEKPFQLSFLESCSVGAG